MRCPANLFADLPPDLPEEAVEVLAEGSGRLRIERILSCGHASPPGFWYEQSSSEWVVLLSGEASLRFEADGDLRVLRPGDWMLIPRGVKHRVESTGTLETCVWLAVHWEEEPVDIAVNSARVSS